MIPYVIICKSCSAKLKVSVPELIGQTVDCPKCDTELTLTPPAGYKNPLVESSSTSVGPTSSFDDLDDVLGEVQDSSAQKAPPTSKRVTAHRAPNPQQRAKKNPTLKQPVKPTLKQPVKPSEGSAARAENTQGSPEAKQKRQQSLGADSRDSVPVDSPMLPDGSWDSDGLKKRKRLIKFGSLGVLAVLLSAVGVSFIVGGSATVRKPPLLDESRAAQGQDESPEQKQPEITKVEPGAVDGKDPVDSTSIPPTASVTDLDGGDTTAVRGAADFSAPKIADIGFDTPTAKQPASPLPSQPSSAQPKNPAVMPTAKHPRPPAKVTAPKTDGNNGDSFVKETPKESPLVPNQKSISEFARALEDAGTVLSEIKDEALLQRESALIGLPKYFVEPLDEDPVDVAKQLAVSVSGVQFKDSPILDVLFELESLSGLPVSFDWDAGEVRATDFSQKISLTAKDENFESLIATVAGKVNLKVVTGDQGLTLTRGKPPEVAEHTWRLSPQLSNASVGELKRFIVRTWPLEISDDDDATDDAALRKELEEAVSVTSDQVTLSCDADMHARLDVLIAGMTAAARPESAQLTVVDSSVTPTVFRIDPVLDRPLDLAKDNPFRRPYRIGSLLRQIRQQAGLNVFMDWSSFRTLGWTSNTRVPGDFNEAICRDALEQLARSLKASWIVIDDKTVLMTSFETTRSKSETEVYPVKFLLQKNLTAAELKRVLEDTLRQQLQLPGVSVVYFGEYDCLIAHAPQAVHRQLYSILNRLWEDLK